MPRVLGTISCSGQLVDDGGAVAVQHGEFSAFWTRLRAAWFARHAEFGDPTRGATAVEYAIMASLIAAVVVAGVTTMSGAVLALFVDAAARMP